MLQKQEVCHLDCGPLKRLFQCESPSTNRLPFKYAWSIFQFVVTICSFYLGLPNIYLNASVQEFQPAFDDTRRAVNGALIV